MKIEKYELKLTVEEDHDPFLRSPARGALMHGVLMQALANADSLHGRSGPRPYTQNIIWQAPGSYLWSISLIDEDKTQAIKDWLCSAPASLLVEHYDLNFAIDSITCVRSTTYEELLADTFKRLPPKYASFDFLTPLVFKKAESSKPFPFPEAKLVLQSALSRWNMYSDAAKFDDKEILKDAAEHISCHTFRLQSQRVEMDRQSFSGTIGSLSYQVAKSELRQLMHLAGSFAEFAGLGAKTAMGLGAIRYTPELSLRKIQHLAESRQGD